MATWTARVEWDDLGATDDYLDQLTEQLAPHHASVGWEREPLGRLSATVTVDAATLRQTVTLALAAVDNAARALGAHCTPLGVEVLDEATAEQRLAQPSIPPLVG